MPTLNIYVRPTDKKEKKIYIRITQARKHSYVDTGLTVVDKQMKGNEIKDKDVLCYLYKKIKDYKQILLENADANLVSMSSFDIKEYLLKKINQVYEIDFIKFCRSHSDFLKEKGQNGRAKRLRTIANTLSSFAGDKLYIKNLDYNFLLSLERYLKGKHIIHFIGKYGTIVKKTMPGLSDTSLHDYMSDIKSLFNLAKDKYNDEDSGIINITQNPFRKYKICSCSRSEKNNIDIDLIRKIINHDCRKVNELAKDVFVISFLLLGINTVDLFNLPVYSMKNGRISYNRSKTKRRKDKAFFSIKIEPEMLQLINKYRDPYKEKLFSFYRMYTNSNSFNGSVNNGLKRIKKDLGIDSKMTFYAARKSWATIAHNTLGYTVYDIAECLNHVTNLRVTEIYIDRDFSRNDKINREMLDLLFNNK